MLNPLKKRFPSLQSLGGDGNTSFLRAARAGNLDKVLEHLKNNIDINTSNANGLNALHLASKDGHIHVVSELLRRGATVDSATKKGNTALHIASLAGQEEVVKLLLQYGASVNVQSQNGFTPLYMAAQENHDSVVKLLLSNGANQSLATEDGFTPLAVAMQQGHDKVVAVLLESDTRGKVRLPALHIAAKKDDVKAATLLLDNDHNPDVTSKSGFTPLHIASHYGNQAIANLLIQKGADVNFSAKHNISPLHVAAKWGKTNMVSLLLEKGANIEAKTRDGLTPLHCAARSGHEQVVDMLLERGAPISAKTKNGLAPLHMAAQGEHVDAARILLYHRAPVDEVTVDYLTALHVAAHCGHVRVAKLLLDRNADANARALNGFTPLHIACKKNRIKVVELLLRHGASISATTESGLTPLHVAAFMGCMNIVIYLLQHDASPDVPTVRGETPLHLAARANQTDIIRILLRNGAQVDARAREQQTPLHIGSRLGNVDIVMLLLQHGAQVDATTKDMYTALHIAAKEGQDEVAAVLIENGAALDAATKKGFTPLHLTAKYGHIKVAQILLQKEADVDAQGKNGVTPLHVACHYDNQNVALLLLEKGASPHATAKNGHTPLHIAARKNQMDIATTLLEYGALANAESKAGFTPLHLSCQEGHSEISNLLIEHKAGVNQPAKNGLTPMHLCAQEDNINVAEILQRNGANIDMVTKAGYTPLHVAAHFGQANMMRFLLQHGANVNAATSIGYTPLHQSAQQGHCHIVKLLLEYNANANAQTTNGQSPLDIARKLGYISVLDSLKSITEEQEGATQLHSDEKYRVVAPEAMHESFMSDSEEEGGEDNMLSDQPYRYLTVDEMKSLGDDSLPIDVTRDERVDSNRMAQSAEYPAGVQQQQAIVEDVISPYKAQTYNTAAGKSMVDGIYMANGLNDEGNSHVGRKLQWKSFLVSFLVDARGGAMRGCRHSGVRMIIPSRSTCQPTRVTCRYVKPQRTMHPPQLMEGEALASRVLELGPVSTKFIGPVIMEVPHFASLRGKEREIIILRSDNGETWREHTIDNSEEIIHDVLQQCFEPEEITQLEEQAGNHVCRFVTYDFPQYFAVVTRIRQEVHAIGPEGGMVSSTVVPQVQAVFPQGALTKKIKVGLQAQPVDPDLTAKLLGRGVAVSPIVTVEPRRRKFHKAITLSMPAPKAHSQGMINQYSGNTPTLRLLCSITGGPSRAQWEDVTGSTPLTFVNDCVSFTTTVSARFWLMDCRNISDATKMATELYKEVIHVPFIAKFVVFAKKVEPFEARLRVFCMTDDREDKTLEKIELYTQVAKSRDVEVLEGKPQFIEMAGNLVPVTKSGEQLQLPFKAFRENRLPFTVRVKDQHADIVGRTLFMKEPKVAKGEPPQHPICILNVVLPEAVIPVSLTAFSDKITPTYRSSLLSFSKHQNDHYIGDIRIVDLSNLLGKDWIRLASEINIGSEEIEEIINHNTDSIARQAQSMIRLYKDKSNYDIHLLEQALKNIGRDDIMSKCKSGRLSHSRDSDETDIMKNSESVEELVRQESKRIQQIHEREEIKYSAEEKEVEESESDEEIAKRTVAERRDKIVKRLSIERQIPASSQKKEITREITEIKRKSLIEDKKAIHESEIFMQLPADNSVKSSVIPDQIIKMKMAKIDSTEVCKSDFDKELTHKLKSSSRSSEEEPEQEDTSITRHEVTHEEVENLKIVKDLKSVEKPSKIIDSLKSGKPSMSSGSKQLTEDFLAFEKLTQLPSQVSMTTTTEIMAKLVETGKETPGDRIEDKIKKTAQEVVTETVETASKKVENLISAFETSKLENQSQYKEGLIEVGDNQLVERLIPLKGTAIDEKSVEEVVREKANVKDKMKAFTEPSFDDNMVKLSSVETKYSSETAKIKENILKTPEIETTTKIQETVNVVQLTEDLLSSEAGKKDTIIEEKLSKIKTQEPPTSVDFKEYICNTNGKSKSVAETIRVFNGDAKKDTLEIKSEIHIAKDSVIDEVKTVYDTKSEVLKDQVPGIKETVVSETKSLAETIPSFVESKTENSTEETKKIKVSSELIKDYLLEDTKTSFELKKYQLERISDKKHSLLEETISEKEASSLKDDFDFVKDDKEHVIDSNKSTITEAVKTDEKMSSFAEAMEQQVTKRKSVIEIVESVAEPTYKEALKDYKDIKEDSKTIGETISDSKDFIITETKTVAETIKSFSGPKLTTSNLEEKRSAEPQSKRESKKLADTIKSLSESFEKPLIAERDREKIIPSTNIEDKIADFEAKKVIYEYHGLEPKPRSSLISKPEPEEKEVSKKQVISVPEAASKKLTTAGTEESSFEDSLEKLEEMKSIVADARKITKDFLNVEQQTQLPIPTKVQLKEETKLVEKTVKTTITFPPVVETSSVTDKIVKKAEKPLEFRNETIKIQSDITKRESIEENSRKLTYDFLTMERKCQPPYEKQTADGISELSTDTSQHSVEKSPIIEHDSENISLEQFEKSEIDTRKITHDFLSMEQKHQPFSTLKKETKDDSKCGTSIIKEVFIQASDIMTTISADTEVPKESLAMPIKDQPETDKSEFGKKSEKLKDDEIEITAPIKELPIMTTNAVKTITQDFLSFEQSRPIYIAPKTSTEDTKTTTERQEDTLISKPTHTAHQSIVEITDAFLSTELSLIKTKPEECTKPSSDSKAPPPLEESRKSLTDAEFCKSVGESITKKMSEGFIEIGDEIKIQETDIPHSQTPPPTPIETKSESQEDKPIQQKPISDEDNLKNTITTLHKTTESSFERVSTISTIETLQSYIPEPQAVSIESVTTQGALKQKIDYSYKVGDVGEECDDDDEEDDDDDYEHEKSVIDTELNIIKSFQPNVENVCREATILVDNVLGESIQIVNEQQHYDHIETIDIVDNNRVEYNSESENYAISCDDVGGLDVIKSPTIESMSGKSFDDNLSFTDEHVAISHSIETTQFIQERNEQFQSMPQGGGKISESQETKSTDITPVSQATVKTTSSTTDTVTKKAALILAPDSSVTSIDAPKPKPRSVRTSSPTEEEVTLKLVTQLQTTEGEQEVSQDIGSSIVPVPKPRSQMKSSDSCKNLDSINEQQSLQQEHHTIQSDSVSLRSFDYTEEISRTDDPSVSVSLSVKSQPIDYPISTTATTTTSEEPATESIDPPSELSVDDVSVETERKTSFYIGESSRNIITKTTPTKPSVSEGTFAETAAVVTSSEPIEATDISKMKEISVDFDEENDVFKEYVTIKTTETESGLRIRRQSSETRNDLLEEDVQTTKQTPEYAVVLTSATTLLTTEDASLRKTSTEQSFTTTTTTLTTSTNSAPLEVVHLMGEDDLVRKNSESMDIETERPVNLDLSLEKSEWETTEKEIVPPPRSEKVVHSLQQPKKKNLTKETITEELVTKTLEEVQESLDAANNELKSVLKDVKTIKESPSEFEFRSFSQILATASVENVADKTTDIVRKPDRKIEETAKVTESDDISTFIGVPENIHDKRSHEKVESVLTGTVVESLSRKTAMTHHVQKIFDEKKADLSLGFIFTGNAESQDSNSFSGENIIKEDRASLGFISSETAEDFSSMEDYYQEKLAKADMITEEDEKKKQIATSNAAGIDSFSEINLDVTMKPFDDVVHRLKTDSTDTTQNRWSVPEIDKSSSSESYYKSFEKSESRPLSTDIENLITQGNSSEYQTAGDVSSIYKETTEFVSALSAFEGSSGKTISSHESMRSLDSQSETSANLGSIDVSELSETLVASSTEEAEEIRRLHDLANEDDSDDSLNLEATDYTISESKMLQQTQMKRSQEMIFKPKCDDVSRKLNEETNTQIKYAETVLSEDYIKPKEVEKAWDLAYPMEELKVDDLKDSEDILLYHGDARRSIDESKYASSLDEGSILSVSMSSTSNINTVVENFDDIIGSVGASSLAGTEEFASSLPDETTFTMEIDVEITDQRSAVTTPPGETSSKRGHKRSESTVVSEEELKSVSDKDVLIPLNEGKESESESDTDPYETEYARQFRSPTDRKTKKKKQAAAEMDHSFETEKRPFTPSQLVAEVIVEDTVTEELEAEECLNEERRPSQNILNYANIPDITVTEDAQPKSSILKDKFEEKILYKVKTEEELHKATDDRPLHEELEKLIDIQEENFQRLVQEQYKQKLAELKKAEIGDSDYDYNKAPDSPDSFEIVDQPDISDEFVIIEEVAKEANEDDLGCKSIRIAPIKYESKHDEEVEKIIIKSAPADPKLGSQIFRDDLNFELEESPPTGSSGEAGSEVQNEGDSANNKRWVEMQLTDNQLRYPYDLTGGILEDIKEEDGEFEVGSSRISSFKDSFSSTPEYDVMVARRYYASRGENDDVSMSSLQEFESLEQAISLENRNRIHQGSTDSSNGSFQRRYILRNSISGAAQGDDISISSLKEFEGLENACIEAHLIEIKAKEEAALLSRSDESNKSNGSDREQVTKPTKDIVTKINRNVVHTEVLQSGQQALDIETLLKHKLLECEHAQSSIQITDISKAKVDSDKESIDSLDMNKSIDVVTSSLHDSFEVSKDGTTKSDIDSSEVDKHQPTREESIESIEMEHMDDVMSKFEITLGDCLTTTTSTTTTSTDADGREHMTVITRVVTKTSLTGGGASSVSLDAHVTETLTKDFSADSLNQMSVLEQTTTSSAGTTATYQTSAGNSQMSGSITSCASSTLMEDSAMSMSGLTISTSYWSHEEETMKERDDIKPKDHSPH